MRDQTNGFAGCCCGVRSPSAVLRRSCIGDRASDEISSKRAVFEASHRFSHVWFRETSTIPPECTCQPLCPGSRSVVSHEHRSVLVTIPVYGVLPTTDAPFVKRVLVSVAMHDGWCGFGISRVIPTEGWLGSLPSTASSPTNDGVLGYAQQGGPIADMFKHFCTRSLCAESWDFVVAACKYEVRLYWDASF